MKLIKSNKSEPSKQGMQCIKFWDKCDRHLYFHYLGKFNQYYYPRL